MADSNSPLSAKASPHNSPIPKVEPVTLSPLQTSPLSANAPLNTHTNSASGPNSAGTEGGNDTLGGPMRRKPSRRANTAERRATHNAVERQRRETLNGRFLDLAGMLPNLASVRRPSKSAIVNSSIALIHQQRRARGVAARELRILKAETDALRREANDWRERAGVPASVEPERSADFHVLMSLEEVEEGDEERAAYAAIDELEEDDMLGGDDGDDRPNSGGGGGGGGGGRMHSMQMPQQMQMDMRMQAPMGLGMPMPPQQQQQPRYAQFGQQQMPLAFEPSLAGMFDMSVDDKTAVWTAQQQQQQQQQQQAQQQQAQQQQQQLFNSMMQNQQWAQAQAQLQAQLQAQTQAAATMFTPPGSAHGQGSPPSTTSIHPPAPNGNGSSSTNNPNPALVAQAQQAFLANYQRNAQAQALGLFPGSMPVPVAVPGFVTPPREDDASSMHSNSHSSPGTGTGTRSSHSHSPPSHAPAHARRISHPQPMPQPQPLAAWPAPIAAGGAYASTGLSLFV